jgi:phosphoribosylformimino-5-aminoimidazole carboxamide ribotide isomerase
MLIIPAIDLKDGRCVRLRQGRPEDAKTYSDDPVAVALRWTAEGARRLHVVDLDGAFQGRPVHLEVIRRIAAACGVPVQAGGGLRTDDDIRRLLDAGAACAIVGTRALAEPESLGRLAAGFGEKLAVGIDARDGRVLVKGWAEGTTTGAADLAATAACCGVRTIIHTDVARDGMLRGANAAAVDEVCAAAGSCAVIASGGVTSADDVRALALLGRPNLSGAIVGKALYEGAVSLRDLMAAAAQAHHGRDS